jgi:hypothetical protein
MAATKHTGIQQIHSERNHSVQAGSRLAPPDLLPWADPYIARLLVRHRLQAALNDSLAFLKDARER